MLRPSGGEKCGLVLAESLRSRRLQAKAAQRLSGNLALVPHSAVSASRWGCQNLFLPALLCLTASSLLQAQRPRLMVVVVAEQFRADYLDLYRSGFSADGFGRLLSEGAVFRRARFKHLTTLGAPNAAVLATGAYPELHGIVGDRWYDRRIRKTAAAIAPAGNGPSNSGISPLNISPLNLSGSTLADELQLATAGRSRVIAISGTAAPAVMLAGRNPDGCYWMGSDGQFGTSSFYAKQLQPWVAEFNASQPVLRHWGAEWKAIGAKDGAPPLRVLESAERKSFDVFFSLYRASPFAIEDVFALAERAIEAEELGAGEYTDLFIINLSAPAFLGLETGANSPLMRDLVLQLDRRLGEFLRVLDEKVGADQVSLVFTAAHGIPPLPERARESGLRAGRVSGDAVAAAMNSALGEHFGPEVFVEKYLSPFVYLNAAQALTDSQRRRAVQVAGKAAASVDGVASYYVPGEGSVPEALRTALRRSWYVPRSGDFMLVLDPYFVEDYERGRGTSSGSAYRYDTDVPLIFLGPRFKAKRFEREVDAADVAPTLAAVLEISAPSLATGEVLHEALRPPAPHAAGDSQISGPPSPE